MVPSAGLQDRAGARAVLSRLLGVCSRLQKSSVEGGYSGKLSGWAHAMFGWVVEVLTCHQIGKVVVVPTRGSGERPFAGLAHWRRLNRDYEIHPRQSEARSQLAMIHRLLTRRA